MTTEILAAAEFTLELSDDAPEVETLTFSYEELEEAIEDYLRKHGELADDEVILNIDIPIEVKSDGLIDIDFEIAEITINLKDTDNV